MRKYRVHYTFEGTGEVTIHAQSKAQAEEMFGEGEFRGEKEFSECYEINRVETGV